jgi:hypothetical protein
MTTPGSQINGVELYPPRPRKDSGAYRPAPSEISIRAARVARSAAPGRRDREAATKLGAATGAVGIRGRGEA